MQTEGGSSAHVPVEFVDRRVPSAAPQASAETNPAARVVCAADPHGMRFIPTSAHFIATR